MNELNPNRIVNMRDGFILWLAYHVFDFLRQVSIFQQIRNVSRWWFKYRFYKENPNASKFDFEKKWNSSRPFVNKWVFPEIWVLFNLFLGILGCIMLANGAPRWVGWVFCIYSILRTFEIVVYQINVLLFDPIKSGISQYRIKSATRMVILLMCNIIEYILFFSVIYLFLLSSDGGNMSMIEVVVESFTTFTSINSPVDIPHPGLMSIAFIESVIGVFMNLICLARFVSLLPAVQTIDNN